MTRPRVLHLGKFYPPQKGGMETHLRELCQSLADQFDIDVIVANTKRHNEHDYDGRIRVHRIGKMDMFASTALCPELISAIGRTPADIVHLHLPNPSAVLAYLVAGHPGRLIVTHHSDVACHHLMNALFRPALNMVLSRSQAIIAFSPNHIDKSHELRLYRNKSHVIPHGLNSSDFENSHTGDAAKIQARYGSNIVLAVGRLVYYKGLDVLIQAITGTAATLLIIGKGPLQPQLEDVARKSGAASHVHFLGEVTDPFPYYQAARIFALPSISKSEAFGIVQLEAMACGTPVVNTNLPSGVPYVSIHGTSGLTVAPGDVSALRQAINMLLQDDALHSRLSQGARQRFEEKFTAKQMATQTTHLYQEVLRRPSISNHSRKLRPAYA